MDDRTESIAELGDFDLAVHYVQIPKVRYSNDDVTTTGHGGPRHVEVEEAHEAELTPTSTYLKVPRNFFSEAIHVSSLRL